MGWLEPGVLVPWGARLGMLRFWGCLGLGMLGFGMPGSRMCSQRVFVSQGVPDPGVPGLGVPGLGVPVPSHPFPGAFISQGAKSWGFGVPKGPGPGGAES